MPKNQTSFEKGHKRQGGRKKGAATVRTRDIADKLAETGEQTPLEFLLKFMRDASNIPGERLDAAKSAAPYIHPRLSSVSLGGDPNNPVRQEMIISWAGISQPKDES